MQIYAFKMVWFFILLLLSRKNIFHICFLQSYFPHKTFLLFLLYYIYFVLLKGATTIATNNTQKKPKFIFAYDFIYGFVATHIHIFCYFNIIQAHSQHSYNVGIFSRFLFCLQCGTIISKYQNISAIFHFFYKCMLFLFWGLPYFHCSYCCCCCCYFVFMLDKHIFPYANIMHYSFSFWSNCEI